MESESQMSEEWNIKCSSLFQRFRSVTKKKIEKKRGGGGALLPHTYNLPLHNFFRKGSAKLTPL